jgi:hydrogenase maturation protease
MKTLVLGLGNELYGDDGVGIQIIRRLKQEVKGKRKSLRWLRNVDLEESPLSGIALLDLIVGYDTLIIVDTIKKQKPVSGRICLLDEKNLRSIPGPSPHYVSIPQMLEIGEKLGLKIPSKIKIIAVEAKSIYNLGEGLTEEMRKALPAIIRKVKLVLKSH